MKISANSVMYKAIIPKIAKTSSVLRMIPLMGPRHFAAISPKSVLQFSIVRVLRYRRQETKMAAMTMTCTESPTTMPSTANAYGIETIPPPIMQEMIASEVAMTPLVPP